MTFAGLYVRAFQFFPADIRVDSFPSLLTGRGPAPSAGSSSELGNEARALFSPRVLAMSRRVFLLPQQSYKLSAQALPRFPFLPDMRSALDLSPPLRKDL